MPRDEIFLSYSHRDRQWLDEFLLTLKPLIRKKRITVWDDTKIRVGKKWRMEIKAALGRAKVAVLFVSRYFLASEFIQNDELPHLLEAAEKEGVKIVWVAVGSSLYEETAITEFQATNEPGKPLNSLSPSELDAELVRIAKVIDALMDAPLESADSAAGSTLVFEISEQGKGAESVVSREDGPETRGQPTESQAYEKMRRAMAEGKWAWRSIERLSIKAGISEAEAMAILRAEPEVELSRGKSGRAIARLRLEPS
jgi:hypothetical protein